jgi:hypothetical protein
MFSYFWLQLHVGSSVKQYFIDVLMIYFLDVLMRCINRPTVLAHLIGD